MKPMILTPFVGVAVMACASPSQEVAFDVRADEPFEHTEQLTDTFGANTLVLDRSPATVRVQVVHDEFGDDPFVDQVRLSGTLQPGILSFPIGFRDGEGDRVRWEVTVTAVEGD